MANKVKNSFLSCADSLFRSTDLAERKKYVQLVEDVKAYGGNVRIFSSLHVSGEKVSSANLPLENYLYRQV